MDLRELRERVGGEPAAAEQVEAVLLEQDLTLREAALTGELERPEPVVLTAGQVQGREPLPEFLGVEPEARRRVPADVVWEAYFRYVRRTADAAGGEFLREWAGYEVALRNALVQARARGLGLDPDEYVLCPELAETDVSVEQTIAAWSSAPDPLAGLRALDEGRWRWVSEHARYFGFAADELAAYARRLVLLSRWHLLSRDEARAEAREEP